MTNDNMVEIQEYFEYACIRLGISMSLPEVSLLPERNQKAIIAFYMLSVIIQSVNDGWEPNWNNEFELKYFPWFSGATAATAIGCWSTSYAASHAGTYVGSRLCFKTRALADEWGQRLLPLYEDYLLINKE